MGSLAEQGGGHDLQETNDPGLVNPITQLTTTPDQFTIFRPLSPQHHNNNVVINVPHSVSINLHSTCILKPVMTPEHLRGPNHFLEVYSGNSSLQLETKGTKRVTSLYLEIRNAEMAILTV